MLVLTRKIGETIHIGNDIVVTVLRTGHGAIRLGIKAPLSVPILRGELCTRLEEPTLRGDSKGTPAKPSASRQPGAD